MSFRPVFYLHNQRFQATTPENQVTTHVILPKSLQTNFILLWVEEFQFIARNFSIVLSASLIIQMIVTFKFSHNFRIRYSLVKFFAESHQDNKILNYQVLFSEVNVKIFEKIICKRFFLLKFILFLFFQLNQTNLNDRN